MSFWAPVVIWLKTTSSAMRPPMQTAIEIDEEVRRIVLAAYDRAVAHLEKNRDGLVRLAEALLEREVLDAEPHGLGGLLSPPAVPHPKPSA